MDELRVEIKTLIIELCKKEETQNSPEMLRAIADLIRSLPY